MQDANILNYPIGVNHDYVPICSMLIFRGLVGIRLFWRLLATGIALERTIPRNKMQLAGWTCFEGKKTHTSGSIASQWFLSFYSFCLSSERLEVSLGSYQSMEFLCSIQGEHRWWLSVGQQKTSWNLGVEKVLGNYRNGSAMISAPVVEFRVRIQSIRPGKAQKKTREPPFCEQLWIKLLRFMLGILNYQPLVGLGFRLMVEPFAGMPCWRVSVARLFA